MNKAEELLLEAFHEFRPHINGHLTAMEKFHRGVALIKAERKVYHKQEVEAISDEDIENYVDSQDRLCAYTKGLRNGAKWFKNKLLKQ